MYVNSNDGLLDQVPFLEFNIENGIATDSGYRNTGLDLIEER